MDETPQPQQPATSSPEPADAPEKEKPLTPAVLSKRYMQEGAIVFLVFLWFAYDGWFTTDEKMKEYASFNRVGAVLLGYWVLHCCYFAVKHRRIARAQGKNPPETPPSAAP